MEHTKQLIQKAIDIAGGRQEDLAEAIGISQSAVHKLLKGKSHQAGPGTAREIEEWSGGAITKEELRPDIWY